jgi:Uma2 family endonuclease
MYRGHRCRKLVLEPQADREEHLEHPEPLPMTFAAFIAWTDRQPGEVRYELVDGFPVALAQPTNAHNRLMMRLYDVIGPRVRARGCDAYTSGCLVPTRADDTGRVPDLLVTCDERDQREDDDAVNARTIRYPKLVAEILSASNDADDLVHKRNEYENLPAIEEYLILDSRRTWARVHRRHPQTGKFIETDYRDGDEIRLVAIDTMINVDELYRDARIANRRQRRRS